MAYFRKCYRFYMESARWKWLAIPLVMLIWGFGPSEVMAAGAAPAEKLVNIADTRFLQPGLAKWAGDLYNSSLLTYGLVVVLVMAGMGLILGWICDWLVGLLGLNLGKMQHHE